MTNAKSGSHIMLTRRQRRLQLQQAPSNPSRLPQPSSNPIPPPILSLPVEVLLEIASYLYDDKNQIYHFEQTNDNSGWTLHIRDVPSPEHSNNRPKRYGCRVVFPIRLQIQESWHTARVALARAHPHFASVLKLQIPPKLADKVVKPQPLTVWDDRVTIASQYSEKTPLPGRYWLQEKTTDGLDLEGWGMVWADGYKSDTCWPAGLPRLGYPDPRPPTFQEILARVALDRSGVSLN